MSHPALPCYPCPHASACCAYGVTLSEDEAARISQEHGPGVLYRTRWGEWRTRVGFGTGTLGDMGFPGPTPRRADPTSSTAPSAPSSWLAPS